MLQSAVLLHGFGGTHRAWDGVSGHLDAERYRALALDLPGHGENATTTRPISLQSCVEQVLEQAPRDEPFVLCGYSMGGRIALHVALAAPERLSALVLVSTSPGIEDAEQREIRRAADERLAIQLETAPYEDFVERWRAQPLFAEDPPQVQELAKADQRRNDPTALAAALGALGAGAMQPLWSRLKTIEIPTLVLAGERDTKYVALGERMTSVLPNASLTRLKGGHVLPLENPAAVSEAIEASSREPRAVR